MHVTDPAAEGRSSKRDQLLATAWELFNRQGYHATGIDGILAEAGVAKMTLYHHFRSKEELIVEVLSRHGEENRHLLRERVARAGKTPRRRLLAVFDWVEDCINRKDFQGCAFTKALAEYQEPDEQIFRTAAAEKVAVNEFVRQLAAEAGVRGPAHLADQLSVLMEGALVMAQVTGSALPAQRARQAAQILIDAALRTAGS